MKQSKRKPTHQEESPLDQWAKQIATLEPEVAAGVVKYAKRLAADRRLAKGDRDFALAQAKAVAQAIRRARTKRPTKSLKTFT